MMKTITMMTEPLYAGTISPLIYGEFMELLNDLIPGMRAEKVQDRSFEGVLQPAQVYPPGQNWLYPRWQPFAAARPRFDHWLEQPAELEMVNARATLALDQARPLVGRQSARVDVQAAPGASFVAGILQEGIAVAQGQPLNVELYLRGAVC